ncbi:hypothetical protein BV25DRAFT_977826 [Artomyces pyxidatus]|uniref:Uncharacterized protein n=1 Tax=Artomyces pyxidatus TaxID=48021 RepID=A0ACB8SWL9_9AGAM|nr:hypothetical protein BV25DRAFT_977826 [Artomyces pyxidatus]
MCAELVLRGLSLDSGHQEHAERPLVSIWRPLARCLSTPLPTSNPLQMKNLHTRPSLTPLSSLAVAASPGTLFALFALFALSGILSVSIALVLPIVHLQGLASVSQESLAFAASLFVLKLLIISVCVAHILFPKRLPFHRILHPRFRYRRTHVSHMRVDRLRRMVVALRIQARQAPLPIDDDDNNLSLFKKHRLAGHRLVGGAGNPPDPLPQVASGSMASLPGVVDAVTPSVHPVPGGIRPGHIEARRIPGWIMLSILPPSDIGVTKILSPVFLPPQAPYVSDAPSYVYSDGPNILIDNRQFSPDRDSAVASLKLTLYSALPHVRSLRTMFDNAWQSGAQAISFPSAPSLRFPLWTECLLGELEISLRKQKKWITASQWLDDMAESSLDDVTVDLAEACHDRLKDVVWDKPVSIPTSILGLSVSLSSHDLATFLSNEWLNDDMIDAGITWILRILGNSPSVYMTQCHFIGFLRNTYTRTLGAPYVIHPRSALDRAINAGTIKTVEIPVNPGGTHWAGIKLDLDKWTYAYRDGFNPSASPSPEDVSLLNWYLQGVRPNAPSSPVVAQSIPTPRQHDGHSCGVVYLSTLASDYLGIAPWSQAAHASERMEWFLRLSEHRQNGDNKSSELASSESQPPMAVNISDQDPDDSPIQLIPVSDVTLPDVWQSSDVSVSGAIAGDVNVCMSSSDDDLPIFISGKRPFISDPNSDFDSDSDSDTASNTSGRCIHRRRRRRTTGVSSWQHQKALRNATQLPDFKANAARLASFRNKIKAEDPHAEFRQNDLLAVRCSACAEWLTMRALYDVRRWKDHRKSARCETHRATGLFTKSLFQFFGQQVPAKPGASTSEFHPCPGLTRQSDPRINRYLGRSSATGGGAPSRRRIAVELFKLRSDQCAWTALTAIQQKKVLRREGALYKWRNRRDVGAVYSTACEGNGRAPSGDGSEPRPCHACQALHRLHGFQVVLNRKMPAEECMKYVPKGYRSKELGDIYLKYKGVRELIEANDGQSPWLRFAKGAAGGVYKSQQVVLGMIEALVQKTDRILKGKSLKNMKYSTALDSFCMVLASITPRGYRTFRHQFAGRGFRSIQDLHAKQPKFEPGFSRNNMKLASRTLTRLEYFGPLSLSWDDTDLEKALSIWQESKTVWTVLGAVEGPMRFESVDEIEKVFENARLEKAEKLRIYVLTIPLPKIPPILLAAIARSSKDSAENLASMHFELTAMMHDEGLHATSLAADGTETERALQRIIAAAAHSVHLYSIHNDAAGCTLDLSIPLFHGHPAVMVQDSKHGAKTSRNQLLTGARTLSLGNFPIYFKMLRDFAEHPLGPLFRRDVEHVDKQDDRAAARLFSAEALDFHLLHFPQQHALSTYLFIFGDLLDAWQNRHISHLERVKMVLRARFFLMAWRSHIEQHPDHQTNIHFISRESYDIFLTICDSLVQLIVTYRKYFTTYPLLPWLHSTETCEHIFGMLRQLKKDFNYADMLYLEPKLRSLMLGAFQNLSPDEQANQAAAGYHHTYFHASDLDLRVLLQWPSDVELCDASQYALDEAEGLLASVGIDARTMLASYQPPKPPKTAGFSSTLPAQPKTLADLLALYAATPTPLSTVVEDEVETYEMALAADDVDKTMAILALPDSSEADEQVVKDAIGSYVAQAVDVVAAAKDSVLQAAADRISALSVVDATRNLRRDILVSNRRRHQSKAMSRAVRQVNRLQVAPTTAISSTPSQPGSESVRDALLRRLASLIHDSTGFRGPHATMTSGVDRIVRHTGVYATGTGPASSRAKQKAIVQEAASSKFVHQRAQAFTRLQDVHENMFNANVSDIKPLEPGHFVLVVAPGSIKKGKQTANLLLAEVITLYTHTGARGVMHEWAPAARSIGDPSYINVQVYRKMYGNTYTSVSCQSLGCATFLRIPRTHFIFSLATASASITRKDVQTDAGHPFSFVTLCSFSSALVTSLSTRSADLSLAVLQLQDMMSSKGRTSAAEPEPASTVVPMEEDVHSENADDELEDE